MSKNTFVHTRFWQDSYVSELDPIEKLLFLYSITSPALGLTGMYEAPLRFIAFETGIDREMVLKIYERFRKDKKIIYYEGWVCVINYVKYQSFKGPKLAIAIQRELNVIPSHILSFFEKNGYPMDTLSILSRDRDRDRERERKGNSNKKFQESFAKFWKVYPRKVSKTTAEKSWNKLKPSPSLVEKILADVNQKANSESWTKDGRRFCPHPSTYINQKRWEDEDVVDEVLVVD